MRRGFPVLIALSALLALAGCGGGGSKTEKAAVESPSSSSGGARACPKAWLAGWQKLANRIGTPVYCPSWLPHPLTGEIGGPWTTINSVSKDHSYLIGFLWKERAEEIHVNLRGYPGVTRIPSCRQVDIKAGKKVERSVPCFSDQRGRKRANGIDAAVYTVGQDADQWHVSYVWRRDGSLYVLSEHVAPPLTYWQVIRNLDRMLRSLVLVRPRANED